MTAAPGDATAGSSGDDASVGSALIAIPAGRVTLSDRRTRRSWSVELAPYRLAAFPVCRRGLARAVP